MKDRLLFTTIGLLIGIVVMQWTMPSTNATTTVPNSGIVAMEEGSGWLLMLDQNGHAWVSQHDGTNLRCWIRYAEYDPPVPASQIKFWHRDNLVTVDNHAWVSTQQGSSLVWYDCGPWPGSPLAIDQSTWGKIKAKFGKGGSK